MVKNWEFKGDVGGMNIKTNPAAVEGVWIFSRMTHSHVKISSRGF